MIKENFLDYGRVPCTKIYFLDCRKNNRSNNFEKNASVEIMKTYVLSLEQRLIPLAFFAVDKINIIFSQRLKHK